ncbi:DUF2239 domain-containing protein [Asaia sp. W19]|uniref:DUF2239 family protein n=1 Tax=unclassified Asaia TaxID=2685023 RepID=UPI000F8CFB5B|nr:DUF2239 family protein [Asaia sp. W19]RUT25827.1 DUF2239 domain-containing protein [Asaia sp. W19]
MSTYLSTRCTAFAGVNRIATGSLIDVALTIKGMEDRIEGPILTFDDASGAVIDLDLRGGTAEIVTRLTGRGKAKALDSGHQGGGTNGPGRSRGRPKLGVIAREVTLLPRHWEWLAKQPGGASQVLRRIVDEARRADGGKSDLNAAHERTYRFLSALAGNLVGYEEAIRALFAGDYKSFNGRMATWPSDIRDHAITLSQSSPMQQ